MKKLLLILLCLSTSYFLKAQETEKQKEIGISFYSLNNFGVSYKTGTAKSLWRFNSLLFNGGKSKTYTSAENERNYINVSFRAGKEFRKTIADNLELRYGADLYFGYLNDKSEYYDKSSDLHRSSHRITYSPGLNLVFGFNYVVNNRLVLGAELLPGFIYNTGSTVYKSSTAYFIDEVKGDTPGFDYGFSSSSALLSIAYRF